MIVAPELVEGPVLSAVEGPVLSAVEGPVLSAVEGLTGLKAGQRVMVVFHLWRNSAACAAIVALSPSAVLCSAPASAGRPLSRKDWCVRPVPKQYRPNPIGVTVVDLLPVEGNVLRVRGLDALNGTPILDIKLA